MRIAHEGAAQQRRDWYELAAYVAWHAEAFARTKRLPTWDQVRESIRGKKATAKMTAAEIASFVKGLKGASPPPLSDKEKRMLAKRRARAAT